MSKSIDFDQVAKHYDVHVGTDFDVDFWKHEAKSTDGKTLELMCGTGRIGFPLIEQGCSYTGLDYSQKLLDQFHKKLASGGRSAELILADATSFNLPHTFGLIFVGFHSLAEVLENDDKINLMRCVRSHLLPPGRFAFSLHNPLVRKQSLNGERSAPEIFRFGDDQSSLEFSHQFYPPSAAGLVSGSQYYVVKDQNGFTMESQTLDVRFHLVSKDEVESMIEQAGFRIESLWATMTDLDLSRRALS